MTSIPSSGRSSGSIDCAAASSSGSEIAGRVVSPREARPDSVEEIARLTALVDDRVDAGDDGRHRHRGIGERGVQDDAGSRDVGLDPAAEDEAVASREPVVDHDHVRTAPIEQDGRLLGVRGAANRLQPGLGQQRGVQPEPDRVMIVDDRDPDHEERSPARGRLSGHCIVPTSLASAAVRFHGGRHPTLVLGLRRQASWHDDAARGTMPRAVSPTSTSGRAHRVVVVGGGFGGLQAALEAAAGAGRDHAVDRRNFHLFQPLTYQVATGALSPGEIAYPLRAIFKRHRNVRVLLAEVTGFDLDAREVHAPRRSASCRRPSTVPYDTLIVAGGSRYSYFGHDEWSAHAPEVKSLESALDVRSRILGAFEAAELETDPERRARVAHVRRRRRRADRRGDGRPDRRDRARHAARATSARSTRAAAGSCSSRPPTACSPAFPPSLSAKAERSLDGSA